MAELVGIYAASHGPMIVRSWDGLPSACKDTLTHAFTELGRRINAARADVLIVISPDHWVNFFIDNLPSICVGVGETHDGPPESWLAAFPHRQMAGHALLAQHIVEHAFTRGFEPSVSYKLALDHGFCIPLWKAGIVPMPAIVPVILNTVEPPFPSVRRCYEWGTVLREAIGSFPGDTRVAILATGGLSHSIGEATMGAIDEAFDQECLQHFASGERDALFHFLDQRLAAAGNGTAEVRNWLAAHGAACAAGAHGFDLIHYSAMPEIYVGCGLASWSAETQQSAAQPVPTGTREAPSRTIPVPDTVSPQMQAIIARPVNPRWSIVPKTADEWKVIVDRDARSKVELLPRIREALSVTVQPTTIAGVRAFIVTPKVIPPRNRDRVLLHLHGGTRVFNPGEAGTMEAILMAGFGGFKVISVDYRMPPDFPFPAALDDAVAVYREMLKTNEAKKVGIFGTSAGGSLTLTTLLRAKLERLPMPGAVAPGTPTVDLTKTGDSLFTNEMIDNVLGTQDGFIRATAFLYADGRDLKDPLLSPIYGDVHGFPPAILTSGTRDLYLSNTVRMHRKLRAAGVEAVLQVWEGQSHAQYMSDINAPEVKDYHDEIARFFDLHLGC